MLTEVTAIRYVTPLREGGSLPGIVEADDLGTYVMKFTGAGQGRKTLVAEVVCGQLGRRLGLRVPELVRMQLDPVIGLSEPDQEVQELLKASGGLNLGMDYLPGSLGFDPLAFEVGAQEAGRVVWFDALIGNVDRSWRNPNLLVWHGQLWLIDHGATMIWHHGWRGLDKAAGEAVRRLRACSRAVRAGCRRGGRGPGAADHRGAAHRGGRGRPRRVADRRAGLRRAGRGAPRLCRGAAGAGGHGRGRITLGERAGEEPSKAPEWLRVWVEGKASK